MTQKKKPLAVEVELQQRQEELELINKELAQSQMKLEVAYRQYADLYDFAPVGYLTLTRNGAIHQVNLAGANLLGVNHNEATQVRLAAFVSSESRPTFDTFFEKLLSGEGKESCELVLNKRGDGLLWARLEATCFENGNVCRALLTDITERKRIASLLQARMRISEFAEAHTFDELLQKTLDEAEGLTSSQIGFAHFLKADQKTLQLQMWSTNTLKNMRTADGKDSHYSIDEAGVWTDCISTRAPLVHNDYPSLAHRKGLPQDHALLLRELVVPVIRNDLIVMVMGVGNKSTDYDDNDVETLSQLANLAWDIVQRKQAENDLRESEEKYRAIIEQSHDGVFISDELGNVAIWNNSMETITGIRQQDAVGKSLYEIQVQLIPDEQVTPELLEKLRDNLENILKSKTNWQGDAWDQEIKCADGTRKVVQDTSFIIKTNKTVKFGVIFHDITERKRAEEALQDSQELFSLFMHHSPIYAFIKEVTPTESRVVQASDNYLQMIGISGREMVGKTMEELFPAEVAAKYTDDDWFVVNTGKVLKLDEDLNGRYYTTIKFPIKQGDKTLLAGYTIDITDRKLAEEAVRKSESLYRKMNENSPLGMHFYKLNNNDQLIFVGANPAADKLLGVDNSQFIGKTIEEAFPPLIKTEVPERYRDTAVKGIPWSTEQIAYEDGQIKGVYEVRAFQTTPGNMAAIFADITERKLAEQALEAANRELQIALALQQQLAHTDALTGINNRRHLYELAEHEFEIATRYQQPLSVIMFDIDHFKLVNDTFGHTVGDQILQGVTQVANAELRSADVIGRYGGEEFVIILPMTNAKKAYPLAERIRQGVAALRVATEKGDASVTLSIGIVELTHGAQNQSIEAMIRNADEAMYAAKQAGRNRTEIGNLE